LIREFITGNIEAISKENNKAGRVVTLLLPAKTDLEKSSPQLFEDSLQDAIIDGVMTSDEAEEIRQKANENVPVQIIFQETKQLDNLKKNDLVYIIAEPYSGNNTQIQGLFITSDSNEFQKAKMNTFREMEKERNNWQNKS
jgi:hypothetical protein